ncbi:glycosyltransferase family 4 protein [Flagellimonas crocea]|uniref:glycosyltransferase family 4 protein n=1 Tax=Flagellimonas crocea TaxID=3067311 RepID=UPI00296FAE4F|nr:glycosyltransferase family 4 protein [Muricauda sp. DH64]
MKILWVTNTVFPDLAIALGQRPPVVGGWMYGLAKSLSHSPNIELFVATARDAKSDDEKKINNITYFHLMGEKSINEYDVSLEKKWISIVEKVNPDVVHIHGTEYAHGLSLMNACPQLNYVISIQGLISVYSRYFLANLSNSDLRKSLSLRDILKRQTLKQEEKEFLKRGESIEKKYLVKTKHVIGRTQWDYAHTKIVNPNVQYHFCNESLRDSFYESPLWEPKQDHVEPTIFLSQASRPLKGLHQVLKAAYLLKDSYPNLKLRIAGGNIVKSDNLKQKLSISGYGKYIRGLISQYGLDNQIVFTGPLDEAGMIKEYTNASMFVCPSSIENSPNSLGEAQLLGVPVIASYVGGVADMVTHEETGLLYRFEEVEMLAISIKRLIEDKELAIHLSKNGHKEAKKRHDRQANLDQLLSIYKSIV